MKSEQQSKTIKTATEPDKQHVIDSLVLAFTTDPTWRWNYPDTDDYLEYFPEFVRIYGGKAFDHGTAHYVEGFAGGSLWLPPGVRPDEDALVELFQESLSEERQEQAWNVLEQLASYYPDEPFWHLTVLGVEPVHQRKGYGTALLGNMLTTCDQEGEVVYLESSNPENIPLYARHGFEILGSIQENEIPPLIPMVREPQR
ncbi:GNAT family N-acetyltransferase [Natrarchaeobius chitinivorans]|uniref:GNAT family N-acetyltransferase n=1 Tax=Natrarchaeobius chitinivorans TaxID=1679083 RepID=A0A3N6P869_NATCH|nr:GNAT family N-acetyltransferase [Natrarchaeobius chitinivorans]RQG92275.1 GNAT family N-acetyltransferase [Natrarchaeobius chitinivorans]